MRRQADHLIIGSSAAGLNAAMTIRGIQPQATILMLSQEPYAPYGRPLISYLIEGKTTLDQIWLKEDGALSQLGIETLAGSGYEVIKLLPDEHQACLQNGDVISYGDCLLATGSVPFVPLIQGLAEASNVAPFMTLDDALFAEGLAKASQERAQAEGRESRAVVIGAGLIGLKAAEALSSHVGHITVLELAPRILPAVLDEQGAALLQASLLKRGIQCCPGISAEKIILGEDGQAKETILTDGSRLPLDMIVAAVGVRPNSKLAVDAGAQQGRGLIVDDHLRTTLPDVYAAGDVTQVRDVLDGSEHPLALWPNAVRQGQCAGTYMAGAAQAEPYLGSFAVNAVDFFDVSLLTAGIINPPEGQGYQQTVIADEGSYAKFVTKDGCLVGYILLNRPTNAGIYTAMIEQRTPLDSFEEDIFQQVPLNLDFPTDMRWQRLHKCYPRSLDQLGRKER